MIERGERIGNWTRWAKAVAMRTAVVATAALAWPGAASAATPAEQLNEVFGYIEELHVGGKSAEALRDAAIQGMLDELNDPYTQYYDEEQWKALFDAYEQVIVGIGIRFAKTEDGLLILRVYKDSAAERAGLREGDIVLRVDGQDVKTRTLDELADVLLGPEGSETKLEVADGVSRIIKSVTIVRQPFHIPSVSYEMMDHGAGYIRIDSFSSDTAALVGEALASFGAESSLQGLVIDIRGNPGGYLEAVQGVASHFIERGALLHTVGRDGKQQAVTIRDGEKVGVPVAVLVDGGSASASEVFAGAMQDYGAAKIVGTRTYGKGSVQQLIALDTGGGLKVTVEHYLTPKRRPVNGVGIAPDIAAETPLAATLAGLRAVGMQAAKVELLGHETVVNGVSFDDVVATIREGGRTFVPSRALAAVAGGNASWDGATSSVKLSGPGFSATFGAGTGLLLRDGVGYIDLAAFAKAFPHIQAEAGPKSVVLEWNEHG
ncbi:S41 family peptidase [Paenibacillus sp.]|uniref:S41 family peptidase n=1 Tax=Paenibacillus sp. TaxID=58172 RepID=UPI002D5B91FC|nr:S41 family peptidase [Paenibacillus sp.]HZG55232.1 S41 family peptidase [Paenibacillus sp.]